jgi:hypothetical protein
MGVNTSWRSWRFDMCDVLSPAGNLPCIRHDCDGRGHVWVHASSAEDPKAEADYRLEL